MKQFDVDTNHFLILHNFIRSFIIFDKVDCINLDSTDKEVYYELHIISAYGIAVTTHAVGLIRTDEVFLF
jgi:hypothetical protein